MQKVNVELFGNDPKMQKAIQSAKNVAVTKAPLLIAGEQGTGKRTLGTYIHEQSGRKDRPCCLVDCSEDPVTVENNILGKRDNDTGKFTKGVIERANGGTVIFANIDCLEEAFQKKLHKILMELADYDIDIRIIVTTTKNLSKLVGAGRFHRSLYTFISGTNITTPALRDRKEDIKTIAYGFLNEIAAARNVENPVISDEAMAKLLEHYWGGNQQELKSVLENSLSETQNGIIELSSLALGEKKAINPIPLELTEDGVKLMSLKEAEKLLIKKALLHTSENRTQAAKILGVSIRTLRNKINEYRNDGTAFFVNLR